MPKFNYQSAAKAFAEKLKTIDLDQRGAMLGAELVRAFRLEKPEPRKRENNFERNVEIARSVLLLDKTRVSQAERFNLSSRQVTNIVEEYRQFVEADEKFFPSDISS